MQGLSRSTARICIAFQQQYKQKAETAPRYYRVPLIDSIGILGF
jgi:hypothetical protein